MMCTGATHELLEVGVISPDPKPADGARRRRGRLPDHRGQGRPAVPRRRHRHDAAPRRDRGARRLPRPQADGVLRACTRSTASDYPELRESLDKLKLNDAALVYEPETLRGARLRLPLRLPRAAAPRDRARAAGARVRPRPDLDGAQRRLPGADGRRQRAHRHQPQRVPRRQGRRDLRAGRARDGAGTERVHRGDHGALPEPARGDARHGLPVRGPGRAALHAAAGRDRLRLLRRAEVQDPRLRLARLRADRRAGRRPGQGGHPAARRAGRRVQRRSCTRTSPTPTA